MGVLRLHVVEVGDGVERTWNVADGLPGRNPERPQHDHRGGRDLLAVAGARSKEERVHGILARREWRNVGGVVDVGGHPSVDAAHRLVGVDLVGGAAPGDPFGERSDPWVGVGQGEIAVEVGQPEHRQGLGRGREFGQEGTGQFVGSGVRVSRDDGVDGARPHRLGRGDGVAAGEEEGPGVDVDLLGVVGVEDEIGSGPGQVVGLDVTGGRTGGSDLVPGQGDLVGGAGAEHGGSLPTGPAERLGPGLAVPVVKGLANPVVGTVGPDPHDQLVPEFRSGAGVKRRGKPEKSADPVVALRRGGVGGQPRGPVAQSGRLGDRVRVLRRRRKAEIGRHPWRRQEDQDDQGDQDRDHGGQKVRPPRRTGEARHGPPHGPKAPESARRPGQYVETEREGDGLGGRHCHQGRRAGQGVGDVTAGGYVKGVGGEDPGEQDGQRSLDGGDVAGVGRVEGRRDEPGEASHGGQGQNDLHPDPRPGPASPGPEIARHGEHDRHGEHGGAEFALAPRRGGRHDHTQGGGQPERDGVFRRTGLVGLGDPLAELHRGPAPEAEPGTARARRRPASRRS